jgi:hypothetical protein
MILCARASAVPPPKRESDPHSRQHDIRHLFCAGPLRPIVFILEFPVVGTFARSLHLK